MSLDFTNDPWGAWGSLIGTVLGQSYNKNAQERERTKADKIIDDMRNQQAIDRIASMRKANIEDESAGQAIANNMAQQAGVQGAQQATGLSINTPNIDFMGQGAQYAEQQNPYQFSLPALNNKPQLGKDYAVNKALQANQTAVNNERTAQAVLAAASPEAQARYNWNPDYTEDNVRKNLRAAGVRQEIIDEKVGEAKKDIAKRARDVLMPSIMTNLYGTYTTDKDGNTVYVPPNQLSYAKAMVDLQTLYQYDPDTAKTYMSGAITPRDLYSSSEEDRKYQRNLKDTRENAKQQHEWKREDTMLANNLALERAKVNAAYKQVLKGGGGGGGLKMSDVKTLVELANAAIASDNPALQKQGQQILARAFTMLGDNNISGSKFADHDPDWNNYNDVMDAAHEVLNAGGSKEQVATELKKHMGDGDLYRKVLSDLGINKSQPSQPASKPQTTSSNWTLFSDWGSGNRTGFVASLQNGGTVRDYFKDR